ncbi:MAG: hypothetical protein IPK04_23195 [Bdellovibrionales bacterium]|jgi:hypothetical protein|nr:hypothetical protein [Bdellovibrionales bacterium]
MQLLENMKSELSQLWDRAIKANTPEIREKLMREYRQNYRRYKRQVRFFGAMEDFEPRVHIEQQTQN